MAHRLKRARHIRPLWQQLLQHDKHNTWFWNAFPLEFARHTLQALQEGVPREDENTRSQTNLQDVICWPVRIVQCQRVVNDLDARILYKLLAVLWQALQVCVRQAGCNCARFNCPSRQLAKVYMKECVVASCLASSPGPVTLSLSNSSRLDASLSSLTTALMRDQWSRCLLVEAAACEGAFQCCRPMQCTMES